jgi:hypothetical protein
LAEVFCELGVVLFDLGEGDFIFLKELLYGAAAFFF